MSQWEVSLTLWHVSSLYKSFGIDSILIFLSIFIHVIGHRERQEKLVRYQGSGLPFIPALRFHRTRRHLCRRNNFPTSSPECKPAYLILGAMLSFPALLLFSFPGLFHAHSKKKASSEHQDERPRDILGRNAAVKAEDSAAVLDGSRTGESYVCLRASDLRYHSQEEAPAILSGTLRGYCAGWCPLALSVPLSSTHTEVQFWLPPHVCACPAIIALRKVCWSILTHLHFVHNKNFVLCLTGTFSFHTMLLPCCICTMCP